MRSEFPLQVMADRKWNTHPHDSGIYTIDTVRFLYQTKDSYSIVLLKIIYRITRIENFRKERSERPNILKT